MMKMKRKIILVLWMVLAVSIVFAERVIFVGDSITGHAENLSDGYAKQMRRALTDAGVTNVEIVCLGGSGQGVGSWLNVVKTSKDSNRTLDVKDVYVKEELNKGADTLVIFLGMNDILAPYTDFAQIDKWEANYQKLIDVLKERTSFNKLILAAPTMCSENPSSYRNKLGDQLTQSINKIAENNNAEIALTRETFYNHWKWLRMNDSLGRMTMDYVHPNKFGHTAITIAMLNAIGQQKTAEQWFEKVGVSRIGEKGIRSLGMMLYLDNISEVPGGFKVNGEVAKIALDKIDVKVPNGLKLESINKTGENSFVITVKGAVNKLENSIEVSVLDGEKNASQTISVYSPWMVCSDIPTTRWFKSEDYKEDEHMTSIDEAVLNGKNPFESQDKNGELYDWKVYYPTADVSGGDNPDSVDFSTFSRCRAFDMGYMVRKIYSSKQCSARLNVSAKRFAGNVHATIYWNGKQVYSSTNKKGSVDVEVQKGENTLVVKSSHVTWQWQTAVSLVPEDNCDAEFLFGIDKKQ